eukprot:3241620-Pleurochrysis_carterae.AAC.2
MPGMAAVPSTTPVRTAHTTSDMAAPQMLWKNMAVISNRITSVEIKLVIWLAESESSAVESSVSTLRYSAALKASLARMPQRAPPHSTCWNASELTSAVTPRKMHSA